MSQCIAKTKTGTRCSRMVKDGNLCFQHKQEAPKAIPKAIPKAVYGKKSKLRKADCLNNTEKYSWIVGKGCFEKSGLSPAKSPAKSPTVAIPLDKARCKELSCVGKETKDGNGFLIKNFPKNYFLFRSAHNDEFKIPSWYSDEEGALRYYFNGDCKRYIVKRNLRLVDMSKVSNFKIMLNSPLLTVDEKNVVSIVTGINMTQEMEKIRRQYLSVYPPRGKTFNKPVFAPAGFITKEDRIKGEYVNLRFARIICKFGFDGWVIPKNTIIDGTISYHSFVQEVMLCNPGDVLTRTIEHCIS